MKEERGFQQIQYWEIDPEIWCWEIDPEIQCWEIDPEIQDIIKQSEHALLFNPEFTQLLYLKYVWQVICLH